VLEAPSGKKVSDYKTAIDSLVAKVKTTSEVVGVVSPFDNAAAVSKDGTIAYIHIITPVANADYTLLQTIYEEFPSESQQMYETYRGAFASNLALASGAVVMDMSKPTP